MIPHCLKNGLKWTEKRMFMAISIFIAMEQEFPAHRSRTLTGLTKMRILSGIQSTTNTCSLTALVTSIVVQMTSLRYNIRRKRDAIV